MQSHHILITGNPAVCGIEGLISGDVLVRAACNELVLNRPVYLGSDLPRKGSDIFVECPDNEDCRFQIVCKDEIVRFESAGEGPVIYLNDKSRISIAGELSVFVGALRDHMFALVSPGNLINLFYIEKFTRSAAKVILTNSELIPVSPDAEIELLKFFDRTDFL
ncbi:MAG: hypothetical protein ACFCUM_16900 [Bacteroidales bacterium]